MGNFFFCAEKEGDFALLSLIPLEKFPSPSLPGEIKYDIMARNGAGSADWPVFRKKVDRCRVKRRLAASIQGRHTRAGFSEWRKRLCAREGADKEDRMRAGLGYDVHRLTEGRRLILGGVEIPFEKGLLGHSDADVLVHAIMDALLGAAARTRIRSLRGFQASSCSGEWACFWRSITMWWRTSTPR